MFILSKDLCAIMTEKDNKDSLQETEKKSEAIDSTVREFSLEGALSSGVSSAESITLEDVLKIDESESDILSIEQETEIPQIDTPSENRSEDEERPEKEKDPIFRELAEPKLPNLPRENRARLQMQSPTRLYFYWSIKNNPFQTLNNAFGGRTGSYVLVTKLVNRTKTTEELFQVEPEGNWWFSVDADSDYRAEIGFYAPNRPFIRVIFSNEIRTPRKSPSKRRDYTPSFNIDAYQFAEVLDAAGYQRDAFEVAVAGDDETIAQEATQKTYSKLTGRDEAKFDSNEGDEIRFAFLALASGYSLEDVRDEINSLLYARLESEINKFSAENVLAALKENFDIFTDEFFEEEEIGNAIAGASLVNFPKRLKKRSVPKTLTPKLSKLPKLNPISSFELK